MSTSGRKIASPGPRNAWNAQLDASEQDVPTQAGEVDAGLEEGLGGGDKGMDAETGGGGYSGDAVIAGHDEATWQPDRPLNAEITGDPRTPAGSSYPEAEMESEPGQKPIGRAFADDSSEE